MTTFKAVALAGTFMIASAALSPVAFATAVPNGTLSSVALFNPTVTIGTTTSTYSVSGLTYVISGTGGFASAGGSNGTLNGTVTFSDVVGTTRAETLTNFFSFDGFVYSASSVTTNSFVHTPGVASSATLYLLGTVADSALGYTATPASLSIQFNNTGVSAFSSALTLSVPPAGTGAVPEVASWAMMIAGFGAIGVALRHGKKARTTVTFA